MGKDRVPGSATSGRLAAGSCARALLAPCSCRAHLPRAVASRRRHGSRRREHRAPNFDPGAGWPAPRGPAAHIRPRNSETVAGSGRLKEYSLVCKICAERGRAQRAGARGVKRLSWAAALASFRPASPRNRRGLVLSLSCQIRGGGVTAFLALGGHSSGVFQLRGVKAERGQGGPAWRIPYLL